MRNDKKVDINEIEKTRNETRLRTNIRGLYNFDNEDQDIKVSIIIPVCNVEQFLSECLDSVVNQTLKEIEIICVNDGSTDNSLELLKEYASVDDRVRIIDKDNAGYGHAMNIGMDMARGEYIGIVESDDFVRPSMMEELYNTAVKEELDIIKGDYYRFIDDGGYRRVFYTRLSDKETTYNRVININTETELWLFANTWSGIYRRAFLYDYGIRHNESPGASYQDNGFWFLTTLYADAVMYLNKPFYYNRRDNENSSVYSKGKVYAINDEYKYIYDFIVNRGTSYDEVYAWMFQKKFDAYIFNYHRIESGFKKDYILYLSKEFREDLYNSPMNNLRLSSQKKQDVEEIVSQPISYYERTRDEKNYEYIIDDQCCRDDINIVFICDDGYVIPTAVAIRSLIRFKNDDSVYNITVVARNLSDDQIRYLTFSKPGVRESFLLIENGITHRERTPYGVSDTALLKFKLPSLLPNISKVLYIDGDVIIKNDLSSLFNTELGSNYAGVVRDIPQTLYEKQIFGVEFGRDYFNSGVMLLNLEQIRKDDCEKALILERKKSSSRLMDQDIYNKVFLGNVVQLPIKNNTLYVNLIRSKSKYNIYQINNLYGTEYSNLEDIRKDSSIIHYCSSDKPWKYYDVPMADEWLFVYSLFNDEGHRLLRRSVSDVDKRDKKNNAEIIVVEAKEQIAIVFKLRYNNYKEIVNNIKIIESMSISVDVIVLFDGESFLDKSYFTNIDLSIAFIDITQIIARDSEYLISPNQQLPKNYYRMVLPELLFDYRHIVVIDGGVLQYENLYSLLQSVDKDELCVSWVRTEKLRTFWETPFMIIDTKKYIENNIKTIFWRNYNTTFRPGLSIYQTVKKHSVYLGNHIVEVDEKPIDLQDELLAMIKSVNDKNMELLTQIDSKNNEIRKLEYELVATRTSFSCRLGLLITALPRKLLRR